MLRELKSRYFTTRLGLVWAVADPAIILVLLVLIRGVILDKSVPIAGVTAAEFFFWGVLAFFMFSQPANACNNAIKVSKGLLSYRQIQPIDIVVARVLIEWSVLMLVGVLAVFVWWLVGNSVVIDDPLGVLFYLLCMLVLGLSFGLFTELTSTLVPDARRVFANLMRPMLFISGLFFTMEMIPWGAEKYLVWNPVLHLVDLARGAALREYVSPGSISYALGCSSAFLLVALSLYHRYRDQFQQP